MVCRLRRTGDCVILLSGVVARYELHAFVEHDLGVRSDRVMTAFVDSPLDNPLRRLPDRRGDHIAASSALVNRPSAEAPVHGESRRPSRASASIVGREGTAATSTKRSTRRRSARRFRTLIPFLAGATSRMPMTAVAACDSQPAAAQNLFGSGEAIGQCRFRAHSAKRHPATIVG